MATEAVSELFAGTAKEVVEKIVDTFELHETFNHKTPSMATLMEHLDSEWLLADLKLLKVQ
jgi:hypothetical protein